VKEEKKSESVKVHKQTRNLFLTYINTMLHVITNIGQMLTPTSDFNLVICSKLMEQIKCDHIKLMIS